MESKDLVAIKEELVNSDYPVLNIQRLLKIVTGQSRPTRPMCENWVYSCWLYQMVYSIFWNCHIYAQNCLSKEIFSSNYLKPFCLQFFMNTSGFCTKAKKYLIKIKKKDIENNRTSIKKAINFTNKYLYGPKLNSSSILNLHSKYDIIKKNELLTNENNDTLDQTSFTRAIKETAEDGQQLITDTVVIDNSRYQNVPSEININYILNCLPFNNHPSNNLKDGPFGKKIFDRSNVGLPSVTTILNETMPPERKEILRKWEEKKKKELGEAGFAIYKQDLFDRGSILHSCIDAYLSNQIDPPVEHLKKLEETWASVKHILNDITEVQFTEKMVVHPYLHYHGYLDCVAKFRDTLVVIEFKTSSKTKLTLKSTFDAPLQLMAYLGALSFDPTFNLSQIKQTLLVIAYPTGLPANTHLISEEECIKYYKQWCQRLVKFWHFHAAS